MSLPHRATETKKTRIWAASYDSQRNAFRVAMEDGQIFLLKRPIPEDDLSEILDVYLEGDGEIFTVIQVIAFRFSGQDGVTGMVKIVVPLSCKILRPSI